MTQVGKFTEDRRLASYTQMADTSVEVPASESNDWLSLARIQMAQLYTCTCEKTQCLHLSSHTKVSSVQNIRI